MAESFVCEKWADGGSWQATLPEGWGWKWDQTVHGWPYICTFEDARLVIHSNFSGTKFHGYDWLSVPPTIRSPLEVELYKKAAIDLVYSSPWRETRRPSAEEVEKILTRYELGETVGYGCERQIDDGSIWVAHLGHDNYVLRVGFFCGEATFDDRLPLAMEIISSIRFFSKESTSL